MFILLSHLYKISLLQLMVVGLVGEVTEPVQLLVQFLALQPLELKQKRGRVPTQHQNMTASSAQVAPPPLHLVLPPPTAQVSFNLM